MPCIEPRWSLKPDQAGVGSASSPSSWGGFRRLPPKRLTPVTLSPGTDTVNGLGSAQAHGYG